MIQFYIVYTPNLSKIFILGVLRALSCAFIFVTPGTETRIIKWIIIYRCVFFVTTKNMILQQSLINKLKVTTRI